MLSPSALFIYIYFFSRGKRLYKRVRPSVCPSVVPSVRPAVRPANECQASGLLTYVEYNPLLKTNIWHKYNQYDIYLIVCYCIYLKLRHNKATLFSMHPTSGSLACCAAPRPGANLSAVLRLTRLRQDVRSAPRKRTSIQQPLP